MTQFGLFDYNKRLSRIDEARDPLVDLNKIVDQRNSREENEQIKAGESITLKLFTNYTYHSQHLHLSSSAITALSFS